MPLARFLKERLQEIATGEMPPLTPAQRKRGFQYGPWRRFHADEDGKISFVSVFTVLAIILFIGLIMNTTVSIREKIEIQNAADSAAYTANLWRARAMNAITTTNHMMGEATAVMVLIDGFGGRLLGNSTQRTEESASLNRKIDDRKSDAYCGAPPLGDLAELASYLKEIDNPIVEEVCEWLSESDPDGKHDSGGAIYDSKIKLKKLTVEVLSFKKAANSLINIGGILEKIKFPPIMAAGYALDASGCIIHVYLTKELLLLFKEALIVDAVELVVETINSGGVITTAISNDLLPALTMYEDNIAKAKSGNSPLNRVISEALREIADEHNLSNLQLSPEVTDLKLPIRAEELPPGEGEQPDGFGVESLGKWEQPAPGVVTDLGKDLEINRLKKQLAPVIKPIREAYNNLERLKEWAEKILDNTAGVIESLVEDAKKIKKQFDNIDAVKELVEQFSRESESLGPDGSAENPCRSEKTPERFRLPKFYWKYEATSQWVRASYPYVDDYRSGILKLAKKELPYSNFATYYANYTNRYTLARAYLVRRSKTDQKPTAKKKQESGPLIRDITRLRGWFDSSLKSNEEDSGKLGVADFEEISAALMKAAQLPLPSGSKFAQWQKEVLAHQQQAIEAGRRARSQVTPEDDITPEDAEALSEQLTRIGLLDKLLNLFHDLIAELEIPEPHMYVMSEMNGLNKSKEPWTSNKELASKLFTLKATTNRNGQAIFMSPVFFTHHLSGDREAFAQSMLYNANSRYVIAGAKESTSVHQPDTGWDTLNWTPPVRAFEWGRNSASIDGLGISEMLGEKKDSKDRPRVRLNWQSKLVPVEFQNTSSIPSSKSTPSMGH